MSDTSGNCKGGPPHGPEGTGPSANGAGNPITGGQPYDRPRVCGARTRAGTPCRETRLYPNGRCYRHGGPTPGGAASPHYKTGKWSKYFPRDLREHVERAMADPDLHSLRQEAAALKALEVEAVKRLSVPPPPWREAVALCRKAVDAARGGDPAALRTAVEELGACLEAGASAAAAHERAKAELRELIQERARVTAVEGRRLHDEGLMLSHERSMALVTGLVKALCHWVYDEATWAAGPQAVLEAVSREVRPILNPRAAAVEDAGGPTAGDVIEGELP